MKMFTKKGLSKPKNLNTMFTLIYQLFCRYTHQNRYCKLWRSFGFCSAFFLISC
uniref:Uncharacterized protein n=1 Tax=Arundo donax TaxID=35708 RepID=A0A0A9DNQ6_ARUDO